MKNPTTHLRPRALARRLGRGLLLAAGVLAVALPASAQSGQGGALIVGAALRAVAGGAELDVIATEAPRWTAGATAGNRILLELADALPGDGLTDLESGSGIVEGVTFEALEASGSRATRVLVTTREAARYMVGTQGNVLTLRVLPAAAPARDPESPPAAPPAPRPSGGTAPGAFGSAPSPPPDDAAADLVGDYRIGPGDVVSLSVFGVEELDRKTRVQADGSIALPLLGRVRITGLTVGEAEQAVARELRERQLVTEPQVLVVVEEYASYGVTVQGAVVRPGVYPVIGQQSLLEVIWAAGGLAESTAADQRILVLRQGAGGGGERIEVDAYRLIDEGDLSLNLSLRPGDRVVVPKPQRHKVYVSGAVRKTGPVEFTSSAGLTVLQAITLAGGPTERANLGKVTIIRQTAEGGQETIRVNVKKIQKGKAQDVPLQNNDTVQVGVWFF